MVVIGQNLQTFYIPYEAGNKLPLIAYCCLIILPCVVIFSFLLSYWFTNQFASVRERIICVNIFDSLLALNFEGEEKAVIPEQFKGYTVHQEDITEWYQLRTIYLNKCISKEKL